MENVSKKKIAFSLCDEKNAMEGIFQDPHQRLTLASSHARFRAW